MVRLWIGPLSAPLDATFREIPIGDSQVRRTSITSPSSTIHLSPTDLVFRRLRSQCVHPPAKRITYHRIWFPATLNQSLIL